MSTYIGTVFNDTNYYSEQTQYGLDGDDVLAPSNNNKAYFLYGGNGADDLWGYSYDDELYGGRGSDYLSALNGDDLLEGGGGDDFLRGGNGNDTMSGGPGRDSFIFDTALNKKTNVDTIEDFKPGKDLIDLDDTIFTKVGSAGTFLKSKKFETGKDASNKKVRILYDDKKGVIKYDPDGSGSKNATKFAVVDPKLKIDHDDFFII